MRRILFLACLLATSAFAQECRVASGPRTTALVELYTSEGCSSCPPADRWLSGLGGAGSPQRFVPVAFHVSYWDYIGWKDRYADVRFTERQRTLAAAAGARGVYTPQVLLGGRDFRAWPSERLVRDGIEAINRIAPRASIDVRSRPKPGGGVIAVVSAEALPGVEARHLSLMAVLTQDAIASRVTAGENRGELLRHDFVARDMAMSRRFEAGAPARASLLAEFTSRADWAPDRMALVAFVQDTRTGEVLQALSAPLCR